MHKLFYKVIASRGKVFCSALLVLALLFTLLKIKDFNMLDTTVSAIGRQQPLWFLFWGTFTSVTVLLNLFYICSKLHARTSLTALMIVACCLSFLLPVLYNEANAISAAIHAIGVILFGVFGYTILMDCMYDYKKNCGDKKIMPYFYALFSVLAAALLCFIFTGFNGLVEVVLLLGAELIMLASNLFFKPVIFCKK